MQPHLTHLFLLVGDLERAKWFWTEAIGLRLIEDSRGYIRVGGDNGFDIGIEEGSIESAPVGCPEITVRVEDVDAATKRLSDHDVMITDGLTDTEWGARHTWLLDPDGRRMSIYSQ